MSSLAALAIGAMVTLSPGSWSDGDTYRTPQGSVRLWAANTPECQGTHTYRRPCNDGGPAGEATRFVTQLSAGRTMVGIVRGYDGDRVVMQLLVNVAGDQWQDVATRLLQEGHACVFTAFTPYGEYAQFPECPR